jgi:hypothetical protein
MANEEVGKTVELIDQKIKFLKEMREMLLTEFPMKKEESSLRRKPKTSKQKKPTRRDQVVALIRKEGPQLRKDIIGKTSIPKGTIASLLADKETFMQRNDGKWGLKEDKES